MKQIGGLAFAFAASLALVACVPDGMEEEELSQTTQESKGKGKGPKGPSAAEVEEADQVATTMINRLFAALLQEFAETTADNAAVNTKAISNIFHDDNPTMRLVGKFDPLQKNNKPQDDFEKRALAAALNGEALTETDKVKGKYWVRKSVPVSTFTPACAHCHDNFSATDNVLVGALMVRAQVD